MPTRRLIGNAGLSFFAKLSSGYWDLFEAAELGRRYAPSPGRTLDFGSSVGELGHLVSNKGEGYDFVEADDHPAAYLHGQLPKGLRVTLENAPDGVYDRIFAIDSLEHNTNFVELLEVLVAKLSPQGVLILSGPTENKLYRIGRKIAGFDGHYHETNIYAIEAAAQKLLHRREVRSVMPIARLFRVSAWTAKRAS